MCEIDTPKFIDSERERKPSLSVSTFQNNENKRKKARSTRFVLRWTMPSSRGGEGRSRPVDKIKLPDASAGDRGREDELLRRIMILRQLDFGAGLRELPAPVVALHPDLGQEIAASQAMEDQLCFVRRTEGRARLCE